MVFKNTSLEKEDIENFLKERAIKAIDEYDETKTKATLGSYLSVILNNYGINQCRRFTTNKHKVTNFAGSMTDDDYTTENTYKELLDEILDIVNSNKRIFKKNEYETIILLLNNYDKKEIANRLNKSNQTISRYIKDSIEKIRPFII